MEDIKQETLDLTSEETRKNRDYQKSKLSYLKKSVRRKLNFNMSVMGKLTNL